MTMGICRRPKLNRSWACGHCHIPERFPHLRNTSSAFNTVYFGETRLDAQILQSTSFRVGVADYRGDGRPDYHYHARVFYGDTITPARASVAGGTPFAIQGLGFQANMAMTVATAPASLLAFSATQLLATAPALPDGVQNVALNDAATGAASGMTGVLTYGAGPTTRLLCSPARIPALRSEDKPRIQFASKFLLRTE